MATETLIANGDGDDAIRVGIAELELHANIGGGSPESARRGSSGHLSRYAGGLSTRGELPPFARKWKDL